MKVAVLGGGAWGGVLAAVASARGHHVALWESDPTAVITLGRDRVSRRSVSGFRLPDTVDVSGDAGGTVADRQMVVIAMPSELVRATLLLAAPKIDAAAIVVCASKGLEPDSGQTMIEVLRAALPESRGVVLSGPSFAQEVAAGLPAALVAASVDVAAAGLVQSALGGERLRIYTSDDPIGVCAGGALKNVVAIAAGCCVVTEGIRASISPFISARELAALRARGLRVEENPVRPGERAPVLFRRDVDLLLHRLGELDLSRAERVQVRVSSEKTGEVMMESPSVPFDAASGEVLIACQRHFSARPHDVVFEVDVIEAGGAKASATYFVPHVFEPAG